MLGASLALGSSLSGGASDFLGGTNSRRIGTMQWMFCTQVVGLLLACAWLAFSGASLPDSTAVLTATAAGLSLTFSLAAFFQAMVVGTISIVAPIGATGAVIPIVAGIGGGERPSAVQVIGIVAAIIGVGAGISPASAQAVGSTTRRDCPGATGGAWFGAVLLADSVTSDSGNIPRETPDWLVTTIAGTPAAFNRRMAPAVCG